ncbi:SdiA-regulated domain-containing protein [Mucilaginibacter sp. ZT4R22]|uniref:SdiA-regulated domain-containing protein n=1 Tax=Mucilaginibacter pankratovii TaxID=2772110 RepID=A0ABR7WJ00_9SPHI|nr:SdiA-regulated domain-containing protein [Mucilaginibacter pankratovii]MBD1362305.1 SdiA-regulated domain-containing protein [Mucilaginibacter pankratovii]
MRKITILFSIALIGMIAVSCGQGKNKGKKKDKKKNDAEEAAVQNPPGYDLSNPVEYKMPHELLEISGIAFSKGNDNVIYAEQDEDGDIYYLHPGDNTTKSAKFGKHGDYEDVAIGNGQAVILRSDGEFHSFPLTEVASGQIKSQKVKNLMPAGEYEGMHFDNDTQKLYVLCKQCDIDKATDNNSGYIFDLGKDGTISKTGDFKLDVRSIDASGEMKKFKFRPSALAKNPLTKQWFILSSINKLLVVTDDKWKVQGSYMLKGFLQPEGMAFDSKGNLYISNEGDEIASGNILLFKYAKPK